MPIWRATLRSRAAFVVLSVLVSGVVASLAAQTATADSLRCDGSLLKVGDPKARLVAKCGEPLSRDVVAVVRAFDDGEQARSGAGRISCAFGSTSDDPMLCQAGT